MKNILLIIAALISLSLPARAQIVVNAQAVKVIVPYQTTCSSVTIGTTPVEVTGNTAVPSTSYGAYSVKVENLNASNAVFCSQSASVASSGNLIGDDVAASAAAPYNFLAWLINPMQSWYCVSAGANTTIMVCKSK